MQFASTGNYSNGTSFDITAITAWSSSNTAIATISNATGTKGLATALTAGTTKITATIAGATPVSTNLTVKSVTLTSVSISPGNPTVPLGTTQQFAATGTFSDGSTADISGSVVWKSSNTPVASISSSGVASTAAAGTTTITAYLNGVVGQTDVTVTNAQLTSISIAPGTPTISLGATQDQIIDSSLDQAFALIVEVAGRLVEDQDLGIAQDGTGDAEPLALAAG